MEEKMGVENGSDAGSSDKAVPVAETGGGREGRVVKMQEVLQWGGESVEFFTLTGGRMTTTTNEEQQLKYKDCGPEDSTDIDTDDDHDDRRKNAVAAATATIDEKTNKRKNCGPEDGTDSAETIDDEDDNEEVPSLRLSPESPPPEKKMKSD